MVALLSAMVEHNYARATAARGPERWTVMQLGYRVAPVQYDELRPGLHSGSSDQMVAVLRSV